MALAVTRKQRFLLLVFIILAATGCLSVLLHPTNNLEIHFIDVGYGDAILLKLPSSEWIMVDGGPEEQADSLSRYLGERGVGRIGLVVVTHFHPDHSGGIPRILTDFPVNKVVLGPGALDDPEGWHVIALAQRKGIPIFTAKRGDRIEAFESISIEIMHPSEPAPDPNNSSVVLRVLFGGVCVLLAADILPPAERELIAQFGDELACDILKAPHHGNRTTEDFVLTVEPRWAIISVGPNPWGAPDPETIRVYKNAGATVLRTDETGHIVLTTDGDNIHRSSE
jgi:competence protein ComEC